MVNNLQPSCYIKAKELSAEMNNIKEILSAAVAWSVCLLQGVGWNKRGCIRPWACLARVFVIETTWPFSSDNRFISGRISLHAPCNPILFLLSPYADT
jgi:hypothetical protein